MAQHPPHSPGVLNSCLPRLTSFQSDAMQVHRERPHLPPPALCCGAQSSAHRPCSLDLGGPHSADGHPLPGAGLVIQGSVIMMPIAHASSCQTIQSIRRHCQHTCCSFLYLSPHSHACTPMIRPKTSPAMSPLLFFQDTSRCARDLHFSCSTAGRACRPQLPDVNSRV